jgi:hypothetical protein
LGGVDFLNLGSGVRFPSGTPFHCTSANISGGRNTAGNDFFRRGLIADDAGHFAIDVDALYQPLNADLPEQCLARGGVFSRQTTALLD